MPNPELPEEAVEWTRYDGISVETKCQRERPKGAGWVLSSDLEHQRQPVGNSGLDWPEIMVERRPGKRPRAVVRGRSTLEKARALTGLEYEIYRPISDLPAIRAQAVKEERERLLETVRRIPTTRQAYSIPGGSFAENRSAEQFKEDVIAAFDSEEGGDG